MTTPEKPRQQPATPPDGPAVHPDHAPSGVPAGAKDADAKGLPTSDRQDSETAAKPD